MTTILRFNDKVNRLDQLEEELLGTVATAVTMEFCEVSFRARTDVTVPDEATTEERDAVKAIVDAHVADREWYLTTPTNDPAPNIVSF